MVQWHLSCPWWGKACSQLAAVATTVEEKNFAMSVQQVRMATTKGEIIKNIYNLCSCIVLVKQLTYIHGTRMGCYKRSLRRPPCGQEWRREVLAQLQHQTSALWGSSQCYRTFEGRCSHPLGPNLLPYLHHTEPH